MLYRRKRDTSLQIDLSPLIDVVFLLLIFFMVSTQFKDDHGLDLSLPGSESRNSTEGKNLIIAIDKNEVIRVGEEESDVENIGEAVKRLLPGFETKMVVLKVDQSVNHGLVFEVMEAAKTAGAEGLTFAAKAKINTQKN